jgi:glycosyltransferase involved in cell wall biosynthesis
VHEAGIVVTPGDHPAFAAGIRAVMSDPLRRQALADEGRRRYQTRFQVARLERTLLTLIDATFGSAPA